MESECDTSDHKPRDEDLHTLLKEGRSGYDPHTENNTTRMVVVEVDGELYDTNNRIKTESLIRKILVEADREDDIEGLYKQIDVELNPKP